MKRIILFTLAMTMAISAAEDLSKKRARCGEDETQLPYSRSTTPSETDYHLPCPLKKKTIFSESHLNVRLSKVAMNPANVLSQYNRVFVNADTAFETDKQKWEKIKTLYVSLDVSRLSKLTLADIQILGETFPNTIGLSLSRGQIPGSEIHTYMQALMANFPELVNLGLGTVQSITANRYSKYAEDSSWKVNISWNPPGE